MVSATSSGPWNDWTVPLTPCVLEVCRGENRAQGPLRAGCTKEGGPTGNTLTPALEEAQVKGSGLPALRCGRLGAGVRGASNCLPRA